MLDQLHAAIERPDDPLDARTVGDWVSHSRRRLDAEAMGLSWELCMDHGSARDWEREVPDAQTRRDV